MSAHSPIPSPARRVDSPLLRGWLSRELRDLDPWLAAMNGLALAFLLTAAVGSVGGTPAPPAARPIPTAEVPLESVSMELTAPAATAEEPAATETAAALEPLATAVPETLPERPEVPLWRDAPEMIDPLPVVEPDRPPAPVSIPRPALEPRDPAPRPVRSSARPNPPQRPSGPGAAPGTAPESSRPGGGSGSGSNGAGAGAGPGRGTTPQPPYPAFARRDRLQGTVVVRISVANGSVTSVGVVSSSGSGALDAYAVGHVRKRWKWPAGTTTTYTQPFRFVLK